MEEKSYKETLNLPQTNFSMKANLAQREPQFIEKWEKADIYHKIVNSRKDKKPFILHDGPPYANGHIHVGHALNKTLKDIIVKYKSMAGYYSPYIPGWDCHGLPIEHQVMKNLGPKGKTMPTDEVRKECRKYAQGFIEIQKKEFKRLGIFGDFEHPYITMDLDYEADILELLAKLLEKDYVYKGLKPVHWCGHCQTALAEAEIEYADKKSTSVYVKFPVEKAPFTVKGNLYVVIWTTTPWTLPANTGIAFNPDFIYSVIEVNGEYLIIARDLIKSVAEKAGFQYKEIMEIGQKELNGLKIRHPFIAEREVKPVFGEHVTLDTGTGAVHTAPGHGEEDYEVGMKYNLKVLAPVDHQAKFTADVQEWAGMHVFEANLYIVEKLKNEGKLIFQEDIQHSYPHCWRCKNPVIFRATPQWFIRVDEKFKETLVEIADKKVKWIPDWGKTRMVNMLKNRPDWCISRQRSWGVPIPALYCKDCGETLFTAGMVQKVSDIVRKEGLDVWFTKPIEHFFGKDFQCKCGSKNLDKEKNILDVWFDSGVSWYAVLQRRGLPAADMYLEGSDQHRGWFQSSLIPSVMVQDKAPYAEVLTHGFLLDEKGKAMHKSAGNVVAPEEVIKEFGADILRLWVTTQDYRDDMRIGKNLLKQTADAYRKIRNTVRFILGNLHGFDPKKDSVPFDQLNPLDKWALSKLRQLIEGVVYDYETYNFNGVYKKIYDFANLELSAFYFDVLKDLLYTAKKDGKDRRSAQTVLYETVSVLTRLMAPVMVFTAEEIWGIFNPESPSVHQEVMPDAKNYPYEAEIVNDLDLIFSLREDILKALEMARGEGLIGASLEALVEIETSDEKIKKVLEKYEANLPVYFISSKVGLKISSGKKVYEGKILKVAVSRAPGEKCPRCWKYKGNIGVHSKNKDVCLECAAAME